MKTGKRPCGCHILSIGHMPASVSFCRMHGEAPDLLKRARAALGPLTEAGNQEATFLCDDIDKVLRRDG